MIQSDVVLEPIAHKYFDVTGQEYRSVTRMLESLSEFVDWDAIAGKVAGRGKFAGLDKAAVLKLWDDNRDFAASHGTRVHNALERYGKEFAVLGADIDLKPMILSVYSTYKDYYKTDDEVCLYSAKHKVAGTTDKILFIKKNSNIVDIEDYKTNLNKGIEYFNKDNKYLLDPVSHLQDCNFNKYSLQLSIYGVMYEMLTGGNVRSLWITFIKKDYSHYRIPVPYLKTDAMNVLDHYASAPKILSDSDQGELFPNFD